VRGTEDCSASRSFIIRAADCVRTGRSCLRLSSTAVNAALGTAAAYGNELKLLVVFIPSHTWNKMIQEYRYVLSGARL